MPKFQLISDIHLEFYKHIGHFHKNVEIKVAAPNLIIAGDLGKPYTEIFSDFLEWCSTKWEKVFYIAGNHEYYNSSKDMKTIHNYLNNLDIPNVIFLDKKIVLLDNIAIAGCTLWSDIKDICITTIMNDYNKIHNNKNTITWEYINKLHKDYREWIENEVLTLDKTVLMITHHAPMIEGIAPPKYRNSPINQAYGTDLTKMIENSNIKVWCYGHSHWHNETSINDTKIFCNPLGYPDEITNYIDDFVFEIN